MPGKKDQLHPKNRRLVLLFDGTWNERSSMTNVARIFEAIDDTIPGDNGRDPLHRYDPDYYQGTEPVQLVQYFSGAGTGGFELFNKFAGAAVGYGLSRNIQEGYVWLSNNYREGDEIFMFGFSRGAYSARSLV